MTEPELTARDIEDHDEDIREMQWQHWCTRIADVDTELERSEMKARFARTCCICDVLEDKLSIEDRMRDFLIALQSAEEE